jgi:hypothetical protein
MLMCMFILYGLYITEILNGILWPLHTVLHFIHFFFLISFSSILHVQFYFLYIHISGCDNLYLQCSVVYFG